MTTGILNFTRVSAPGDDANVHLRWELIRTRRMGESQLEWKVLVIALRAIGAFEELVRAAPQKEQYLLHQSPDFAKRGFMKYFKS